MNLLPFSRIRCVRPVVLRFSDLYPAFFGGVEHPLARPVFATCVYAAISRCNRVASVRAWDGSC